jgi:hypothetical protein
LLARLALGLGALATAAWLGRAETPAAAAPPYSFPNENTWVRVQNIGQGDATLEVSYFDEQGKLGGKDVCPSQACPALYPGSGWTFFQRNNAALPAGFSGSAVVSTDQPIVALLAKDVLRANGSFSIGGDTVATGAGAHRLYLPAVSRRAGPQGEWNTRFAVQNLSDAVAACVTITYLNSVSDDEVAWEPYRPPASGTPSVSLPGCPHGGMPLPPKGSLLRHAENMSVPDRFVGSARIDLHNNAQGQAPERQFIAASVEAWSSLSAALGSYRALSESELGTEIVLPLIDRQVGPANAYSTRFQIVNKSPNRPATVTMRVDGYSLGEANQVVTKSHTFQVRASRLCAQDRDDAANCLAPGDRLPPNFVGTVRLTSSEPIAAVAERATTQADTFTDYRGARPQDGSRRVLLPVLNKNYGAVGNARGWNSWFRVMIADGSAANVTVRYYGLDLPGGSVTYTLPVVREFTVFQYQEDVLPSGFAGTAIIESDKPLIAVANLFTDVFTGDPDLLYNGISLER